MFRTRDTDARVRQTGERPIWKAQHVRADRARGSTGPRAARQPIAGAGPSTHGGVCQVFREGTDRRIVRGKGFLLLTLEDGGEGGIRTTAGC